MDNILKSLAKKALEFRDERNWAKYHTGKDLAMCLSIESSEIQELFLWKNDTEVDTERLADEIGDVFYSLLLLADKYSIDIENAVIEKIEKNKKKYPIGKFIDSNKKYNQ